MADQRRTPPSLYLAFTDLCWSTHILALLCVLIYKERLTRLFSYPVKTSAAMFIKI